MTFNTQGVYKIAWRYASNKLRSLKQEAQSEAAYLPDEDCPIHGPRCNMFLIRGNGCTAPCVTYRKPWSTHCLPHPEILEIHNLKQVVLPTSQHTACNSFSLKSMLASFLLITCPWLLDACIPVKGHILHTACFLLSGVASGLLHALKRAEELNP